MTAKRDAAMDELTKAIDEVLARSRDEPQPDTILLPNTPMGRDAADYLERLSEAHKTCAPLPKVRGRLRRRMRSWLRKLVAEHSPLG